MHKPHIPTWLRRVLDLSAGHRYYPLVVALIAFVSTATFAFPFAVVLIPAVLLAPRRWWVLALLCGISSGMGAAVLVQVLDYLGHEWVFTRYPEIVQSENWQQASAWLQRYGLLAIAFIAGSPMPQTPALFLYALASPSIPGVFVAVGLGKTLKYIFLAWATARYPARFIDYR